MQDVAIKQVPLHTCEDADHSNGLEALWSVESYVRLSYVVDRKWDGCACCVVQLRSKRGLKGFLSEIALLKGELYLWSVLSQITALCWKDPTPRSTKKTLPAWS